MSRLRAVVLCPGRGSYDRSLQGALVERESAVLDLFDDLRRRRGQPTVRELDASPWSPRLHLAGEHASILTAGASLSDLESLDPDKVEVVGVAGNSMGWYTALGYAGALDLSDCGVLIDTLGAWQAGRVIGGQALYPVVDEDWRPDPARIRAVEALVADTPDLHISIHLGGRVVLGGTDAALSRAREILPEITEGGRAFPLRLPLHSAFHTPLMADTAARARAELSRLGWRSPGHPLIDGRGRLWNRDFADPAGLRDYTLGAQMTAPFNFGAMVRVALGELAPDLFILPGPGDTMGGPVAQVMIACHWRGLRGKADFLSRQEDRPLVLSLARPEQRARVTR